ncbi:pentatricopeptide repeat-containing protein At3g29290 isoform X2 [Amborella trichopoda]|uniref:Pentacotripeptide-repeat region of PRORP domain-containing protein n=1 Tax=Amborella trichopoda TaxID=13333 RepID=W1NX71_AMBTC|nr:pentatricopeptide repeat-containing protein At3g29290 isoform X2 [Amborella trichopoda]ERM99890.1 hypothetical protein AMTR_s00110p00040270 [Amborella trichopoda]|eukprot:XP_020519126.1 pentatricopeptide repeat-containing protein At3g29290 isoform X2 [Amborella trichopoda]
MAEILNSGFRNGVNSSFSHLYSLSTSHKLRIPPYFRGCKVGFLGNRGMGGSQKRIIFVDEVRVTKFTSFKEFNGWVSQCSFAPVNYSIRAIYIESSELNSIESKAKIPPWGVKFITEDKNVDSTSVFGSNHDSKRPHPDMSKPTSSSDSKVQQNELKMHFLEETNEESLSKRILVLSRSNKINSALELYMSMEMSSLQPNLHSCNSLISCLLRNNRLDDALKMFDTMKKKRVVSGHTYSLIFKAISFCQGWERALKMFNELKTNDFDIVVYNTLISICGKENQWDQVQLLWRGLKQDGHKGTMVTYSLLVSIFVRNGRPELAIDAYHEMIENGCKPREDVLKAMVSACAQEGQWALALSIFRQMLKDGLHPNAIAYNTLINCLGKVGEVKLAIKIYNHMKASENKPDTYTWNALLSALYIAGQYDDALLLFERIDSSQLNIHIYNLALMSCKRLGLWKQSLQLLWKMEANETMPSTLSYNHVIGACEVARKPKVALQVYEHMLMTKCTPDTFTYVLLIRACVVGALWDEVMEILNRIQPNASLYNALIYDLCSQGKITSAKMMYSRMRAYGLNPDGRTRALMLQHLPSDSVKEYIRACNYSGEIHQSYLTGAGPTSEDQAKY